MRLIDADELLKGKEDHQMISTHLIWNAPTIDAVPVIRCKECKYWDRKEGYCVYMRVYGIDEDDFCSIAARKEE